MGKKANALTALVLVGLVAGALAGHFFVWDGGLSPELREQATDGWRFVGQVLFVRPLMLLIIPLVFTSVLLGITSIGDPKRLGLLGSATLVYYVATMALSVSLGVTLASTVRPGDNISEEARRAALQSGAEQIEQRSLDAGGEGGLASAWREIAELLTPNNIIAAAAEGETLSVIAATILLGAGMIAIGRKAQPFLEAVEALHEALMQLIMWLIWLMPVGVFCLVAWAVGRFGLENLAGATMLYVLVVLIGLGAHALVTLPVTLAVFGRVNPYRFLWRMRPALLMAFGTASSLATLPVTIETATRNAGVSKRSADLVLPLGATVNMDGTALYQGVTVIFMFQAFGIDLAFTEYLVIVLTATLSAVGAAGVPGGSLATIVIIIGAVNTVLAGAGKPKLPLEAIGLIIAVDRFLDMLRTSVNVWGDSVGAKIISRLAPDTEEEREQAFA